jgi:hypothetical protein
MNITKSRPLGASSAQGELKDPTCNSQSNVFRLSKSRETAASVVWIIWAAMAAAALAYVLRFGSNVPFWDEWTMVDVLDGSKPANFQWLWSPHNGHRLPLPRLVLLALYKLSGADFRVGMYFNVAALSSAAAALIWGSQRMRGGKLSVTDAVFPLLLLNWGHYENLLWSWQTTQVLPIMLVCVVLAVIAAYGLAPSRAAALVAGVAVVMLPLSGVPGLAFAPALAVWAAASGAMAFRLHRRSRAAALWTAAAVTIALVVVYFYGYTSGVIAAAHERAILRTSVKFIVGGFGPVVRGVVPAIALTVATLLLVTGAALGWAVVRRNERAQLAISLLFFFGGAACLVVAFAIGRAGVALLRRYSTLAAPLWCAAYLAWPSCAGPKVATLAQRAIFTAVLLITPLNLRAGLHYARDYHARMEQFRADLLGGMSPAELVARHVGTLCPSPWRGFDDVGAEQQWGDLAPGGDRFPIMDAVSWHDWMPQRLRKLSAAKIGDFAQMRPDDPPMDDIKLSLQNGFVISRAPGPPGEAGLERSAILITPDRPLYIAGLRIRRPSDSPCVPPGGDARGRWLQVFWRSPGEPAYMVPNRLCVLLGAGKRRANRVDFPVGEPDCYSHGGPVCPAAAGPGRPADQHSGASELKLSSLTPC